MKITIGANRTRYSTEDFNGYIAQLRAQAEPVMKLRRIGKLTFPNEEEAESVLEVGYWNGKVDQERKTQAHHGQRVHKGPWFCNELRRTASDRLLISTPERVSRHTNPLEQLAAVAKGEYHMHPEVQAQIGAFLLSRMKWVAPDPRPNRRSSDAHQRLLRVREAVQAGSFMAIRVLPNIEDPKPQRDPEAHKEQLWETFQHGGAATRMAEAEGLLDDAIQQYRAARAKNEQQRRRLTDQGEEASPSPTIEEVLRMKLNSHQGGEGS
jgi:hypothetical protein